MNNMQKNSTKNKISCPNNMATQKYQKYTKMGQTLPTESKTHPHKKKHYFKKKKKHIAHRPKNGLQKPPMCLSDLFHAIVLVGILQAQIGRREENGLSKPPGCLETFKKLLLVLVCSSWSFSSFLLVVFKFGASTSGSFDAVCLIF